MNKIALLFFVWFIFAGLDAHTGKTIIQVSVPKSGTNLLLKVIKVLMGTPRAGHAELHEETELLESGKIYWTHSFPESGVVEKVRRSDTILFFMTRDPRDQVVSNAFYMKTQKEAKNWPLAQHMSMNDLVVDLITKGESYYDWFPAAGVDSLYRKYMSYLYDPTVCVVSFERLVGVQGGGSLELQLQELAKIAAELGIKADRTHLLAVARKAFGGTRTFRTGRIGDWKNRLNENHKNLFKEYAGQLLVDLGYENDLHW